MKIGNIVSNSKIEVSENFNVVDSLDGILQGLPTLIIGWDFVDNNFKEYDIINRKINENTYWTFKKTENRSLHEEDLYNFVENTYQELVNEIKYIYIDPILFSKSKIKKIIRKILSIDVLYYYQHKDMVYIYGDKLIFGVDLSILEFIGLKKDKFLQKIKDTANIFLVNDTLFIEYKKKIGNLDNQVKYVPYLYSIENG